MVRLIQELDLPLLLILFLSFTGTFLFWIRKKTWVTCCFVTSIFVCLLVFSNRIVPQFFMSQLENQYPSLLSIRHLNSPETISFVVVLGGHNRPNPYWPISSQLGSAMLSRLSEGIQLYRQLPNARLVLSGGGEQMTDAETMKEMVLALGIDENQVILETKSKNTYEEALFLREVVRGKRFILVTSARHMPRAMMIFQSLEMVPIPAPTDHIVDLTSGLNTFIPKSKNISLLSETLYEYFGFLKMKISRKI